MSIAQLPVAGEGNVYPAEPHTDTLSAASEIYCDTKNLPYLTLRAHQRALTMTSLPARARSALAAIAQTVSCRLPLKEVFAHRATLAQRAGMSDRTWYRAEADLVAAGLITIAEQGRKARHGRFGSAYIYLTELCAKALGLIGSPVRRTEPLPPAHRNADTRAGTLGGFGSDADLATGREASAERHDSFAPPSAKMADPYTNDFYQSPSSQERQQGKLPCDLERLQTLGFRKNFIFKLMKESRLLGKRLSDVVEATWDSVKAAKFPISYLRALIHSPTDFSWQVRERRKAAHARVEQRERIAKTESTARECAGQTLYSTTGQTQYTVSLDASELLVHHASEPTARIRSHGWQQDFLAAIEANRIVVATAALRQAFEFEQSRTEDGRKTAQTVGTDRADVAVSLSNVAQMKGALKRIAFGGSSRIGHAS